MNVEEVSYDTLFDFIIKSQGKYDFTQRIAMSSMVILYELNNRLSDVYFPIQLPPIIDDMNKEINELVENVNIVCHFDDVPEIEHDVLFRIIEVTNQEMLNDYNLAKNVIPN